METNNSCVKAVSQHALEPCKKLCASPLIQGAALESLKELFRTFQRVGQNKFLDYNKFKEQLMSVVNPGLSKQSFTAISQCVAAITYEADAKVADKSVQQLRKSISDKNSHLSQISLLTIGEIGSVRDLSSHKGLLDDVFAAFQSSNEAVKWAASYALGRMAVGSLETSLARILTLIEKNPDKAYLLLNSLKEVINAYLLLNSLKEV